MISSPLVSICLVTYNHENYIRKAIEGVLLQEKPFEWELIIGDDASTDDTVKIVGEYVNNNMPIFLISNNKNKGLNENFLHTLSQCRGKYIAYLEGDDHWITHDKLKKQVKILEQNPDISMVHTNFKSWLVDNDIIIDRGISFQGNCIRENSFGLSSVIAEFEGTFRPIKTSTCCYRRRLLIDILKDDEFAYLNKHFPTQDFQLFQDLGFRGKFAFIDEDTTVIGVHNSISNASDAKKRIFFRYGMFRIGIYYIEKYNLPKDSIQSWLKIQLYYFSNAAVFYGENKIFKEIFSYSIYHDATPSIHHKIIALLPKNAWISNIASYFYKIIYRNRLFQP